MSRQTTIAYVRKRVKTRVVIKKCDVQYKEMYKYSHDRLIYTINDKRSPDGCKLQLGLRATGYWLVQLSPVF